MAQHLNTVTEQSEAALLLLTDGCVCGECVCVCVSAHIWGKIWPVGGGAVEFGEEEEKCGERSAEEQLVRPPLQPAAPSDEPILSLPACPEPAPTPPEPPDPASKERRTHTHT